MTKSKNIPENYDYFTTQANYLEKILKELCLDLELNYPELKLSKPLWIGLMEDIIIGYIEMVQDDRENGVIPPD